jgi:purine-binding chemotaxis protein CheW
MSARDELALKSHFVVFRISGQFCAFPMKDVQEVIAMASLAKPPGLPSLLEGFLNLGGQAVPILRADRLLGLPTLEAGLYTHLLILKQGDFLEGLMVDQVQAILTLSPTDLRPIEALDLFNGCCTAEISGPDGPVHLLSAQALLLEKERAVLREHSARMQQRLEGLT